MLRNVQLMLDASFALMNQYSAITANIVVNEPAPTAPTENVEAATNATVENVAVKVSLSTTDDNIPSTSAEAKKRNQEDLIKIEDLGSDDQDEIRNINLGETSEANELRRRRLQKFLQTEQKND